MEVEVVGIIALGIQVCGEVNSYIEGCKAAPEELESIAEQLATWQTLLITIRELTENDKAHNRQVNQHVQQSMRSVEKRIKAVQKAVRKLGPSSRRSEVQELDGEEDAVVMKVSKKQRLLYGMRREKIKALMANVNELNNSLALSLHLYHIEFNSRKAQDVDAVLFKILTILNNPPKVPVYTESAIETTSETDVDPDTSKDCAPVSMNSEDTLCEEPQVKGTELAITSSYSDCTCSARRKTERLNKSWGWFSVTTNRIEEIQHEPGCVWTDLPPAKSAQATTVSIRTGAYWRYFATAITASYDRNISILPVVQTFNLRDLSQSPVVQLIDLADFELDDLEWDDPFAEQQAQRYWHKRLMELFRNGKASPRDVDYESNRTILHFLPFPSQHKMRPYTQLTWQTLNKLNFSKNMMLCDGLAPWEYNFSKSVPMAGNQLRPALLPWNADRWLEPDHIPEALLTGNLDADGRCARAFVLAKIMHAKRSLLETSNVGLLCQAIILRSASKALQLLEDGASSWAELFLGDDSDICAVDLAIMWFPELINSVLHESAAADKRLLLLRPPRPHPSRYSFLEVAINVGLRYGSREGEAPRQAYLELVNHGLEHDHPVYLHRLGASLAEITDIQEPVIAHLADRRQRLQELASRRLPRYRFDHPELFEDRYADEKIEVLLEACAGSGLTLPDALHPRDMHGEERLSRSIFESVWQSEELCTLLESHGFDPEGFIRSRCVRGPFPMVPFVEPVEWNCWQFFWLMRIISTSTTNIGYAEISCACPTKSAYHDSRASNSGKAREKLMNTTTSCSGGMLVHALTAYVGKSIPGRLWHGGFELPDPKISPLLRDHILSTVEDNCDCGCSTTGCSPLLTLLKVLMAPIDAEFARSSFSLYSENILHSIRVIQVILNDSKVSSHIAMQVMRLHTFNLLTCRHTCCIKPMKQYIFGYSTQWPCDQGNDSDREEIRQEDSAKLDKLENFMAQLETDYMSEDHTLLGFFETRWLPLMQQTLQEEAAQRLSEIEIRKAQDVGVKWESVSLRSGNEEEGDFSDTESVSTVYFEHLDTDQDRLREIMKAIDAICI